MYRKLFGFVLLATGLCAQNSSGSLNGSVQDSTGSVIPGLAVTLASDRTGFSRTTRTNESGLFAFPDLTPAAYTLKINASGFSK